MRSLGQDRKSPFDNEVSESASVLNCAVSMKSAALTTGSGIRNFCRTKLRFGNLGGSLGSRQGVSAVETVAVMSLIIGCLMILLGGMSDRLSRPYERAKQALLGQPDRTNGLASGPLGELAESPRADGVGEHLLKMGIFISAVVLFLAYSVAFMSKSEANNQSADGLLGDSPKLNGPPPKSRSFVDSLLDKRNQIGMTLRNELSDFDCDHLSVAKFMTVNPTIVSVSDDADRVRKLMMTRGFRHLLVIDDQEQLCGIISDRDIVNGTDQSVARLMTPNPYSVESTTPVSIAITMLVKNRISALPVVEDAKVVGILTRSDLLVTLQCLLVNVQQEMSQSSSPVVMSEEKNQELVPTS